ncbi:MAG: tetratricopeptide repeat protein [Armatimonadetes bacterium]|nr:tetratricopeptide repeat protein [Armatimonadota bacterium]
MWQLHSRWQLPQHDEARKTEQIRLETFRLRGLLVLLVILASAGMTGALCARFVHPLSYVAIGLWALGGAAAALLLVAIPGPAWRVLRRLWIFLALWRRRRTVRRLVRADRHALSRLTEDTPSSRALCDLAVAEYLRGHLETAEAQLAHALELEPDNHDLLNNLGVVLARREQPERAAELFVRAMRHGANGQAAANCALVAPLVNAPEQLAAMVTATGHELSASALNNVGVALALRGDWEGADEWLSRAAQTAPELAPARANAGLVAYHRRQLQDAANEIMQAARQDPAEPAFANYLGVILISAGQMEPARAYLRRAHRVAPGDVPILINMTAADAAAGHWRVAQRGFRSLLHRESHRTDAAYNLAVCQLAIHEPARAADTAAAAIEVGDTGSEAYTVLAVALWELGRRAEALSHFQSAHQASDAGPIAYSNLARAGLLQGDISAAQNILRQALQRWPDDAHLVFDASTAALAVAAKSFDGAAPLAERQSLMVPAQQQYAGLLSGLGRHDLAAEAHVNLGLYHYMQEQHEKATEQFEAASRLLPRSSELTYLIGTTLAEEGERQTHRTADGDVGLTVGGRSCLRRAVPFLESASEARELTLYAARNLGRCLYLLKDFDQALTAFRKSIRTESKPELASMAALAAARQAHRIQLLFRTQMLSDVKRDQLRSRALELLDVAVHYFRQALLHDELDPVLHGNLGIAYMLRNRPNDVEAALRHWERMRVIGRGAMDGRYADLAQLENLVDPSRVGFDDRSMKLQGLEPLRWVAVPPPRPTGIRFVLEPMAVRHPWQLATTSQGLQHALRLSDAIAAAQVRLQRLRV